MGNLQKPQNRRLRKRSPFNHSCSICMYTSSRRFNIVRHEQRIHSASIKPRRCCDELFGTKGEYYLHCEEYHPDSRSANFTSRTKYKILPEITDSQSPIKTEPPIASTFEELREVRYMLRSRAQRTIDDEVDDDDDADDVDDNDRTNVEIAETSSPKSPKSADESDLDDSTLDNIFDSRQSSSGYETKNSFNSTSDITDSSYVTNPFHPANLDEIAAMIHQDEIPRDDDEKNGNPHELSLIDRIFENESIMADNVEKIVCEPKFDINEFDKRSNEENKIFTKFTDDIGVNKIFTNIPDVIDENKIFTQFPDVIDENKIYTKFPNVVDENKIYKKFPDVIDEGKIFTKFPNVDDETKIFTKFPDVVDGNKIFPKFPDVIDGNKIFTKIPDVIDGNKIVPKFPGVIVENKILPKFPDVVDETKIFTKFPDVVDGNKIVPKFPGVIVENKILPKFPDVIDENKILPKFPNVTGENKIFIESPTVNDETISSSKKNSGEFNVNVVETTNFRADDRSFENFTSFSTMTTMMTCAPSHLPPKKRILLSLGLANRQNTAIPKNPMGDRLGPPKIVKIDEKPMRKKHQRLSKKTTRRTTRGKATPSRYASSAANDAENVDPLGAIARKQMFTGLKVDLRSNGRFAWDDITRLMRERLRLIDFESFKTILR